MCTALALPTSELPDVLVEELRARVYTRETGAREVRFYWRAVPALLPVWWGGRLRVVRWGNRDRDGRLPPCGWTWRQTVEAGRWAALAPEEVEVPAVYGFTNGVWFRIKQGVRGLLVRTPAGEPVVYLLCEPATRYYRVQCRSAWEPVFIGEVI